VSALLEAARRGEDRAFPTAVVLPAGACADEFIAGAWIAPASFVAPLAPAAREPMPRTS
jgi:hypothetical protein